MDRIQLAIAASQARKQRAALARVDPAEFCAFVLRDEKTGRPLKLAPAHYRMHELASKHDLLVMWAHVMLGKTTLISVGRVLWELGKDPSLRVAIVSNTKDLATKIVRLLGQYIEKSEELHEVFPLLQPTTDPSLPWRALALTVNRKGVGGKDPSVQAAGMHGNIIGSRVDLAILDDYLDEENTKTPVPREDAHNWVKSALFSRLTPGAHRVWVVGNAFHPLDSMHRLAKEDGFVQERFPVIDRQDNLSWPEKWPRDAIEKARVLFGPLEAARKLFCVPRDDESARFKKEWLDRCFTNGNGKQLFKTAEAFLRTGEARTNGSLNGALRPVRFFTGVDLAVQSKETADYTVFFTIAVFDTDGLLGVRRVLSVESGHWSGPETIKKIEDHNQRYGSVQVIENNAAQDFILQFAGGMTKATIRPFTTGRQKAHPEFGVESLAAEFAAGRWVIPNDGGKMPPEIVKWIDGLLEYEPPPTHTSDHLMASYFAREGAALEERRSAPVEEEGVGW